MFVLVLAAEADETRQTVTLLIISLVGIALALTVLTVWYWFYTDPSRQPEAEPSPARGTRRDDARRSDDVPLDTGAPKQSRASQRRPAFRPSRLGLAAWFQGGRWRDPGTG